jgi:hypothetical protein
LDVLNSNGSRHDMQGANSMSTELKYVIRFEKSYIIAGPKISINHHFMHHVDKSVYTNGCKVSDYTRVRNTVYSFLSNRNRHHTLLQFLDTVKIVLRIQRID